MKIDEKWFKRLEQDKLNSKEWLKIGQDNGYYDAFIKAVLKEVKRIINKSLDNAKIE